VARFLQDVSGFLNEEPQVLVGQATHPRHEAYQQRGVDMKRTLLIATIAIVGAAGHLFATTVDMPLVRRSPSFARPLAAGENTKNVLNGRWQGTTVSGQQLVLELQVEGERMTGRLTVGKQSAKITSGKVVGELFALTTGPIDGHEVDGSGFRVGDAIELTIEGVKKPLKLTRLN
jgi:hypothetical protein